MDNKQLMIAVIDALIDAAKDIDSQIMVMSKTDENIVLIPLKIAFAGLLEPTTPTTE